MQTFHFEYNNQVIDLYENTKTHQFDIMIDGQIVDSLTYAKALAIVEFLKRIGFDIESGYA